MPPLQTQNHMQNQPRAYSPQSYQQSPGALSPTSTGIPPAKRQRLSPGPQSPAYSPYSASPYAPSPYATSPPAQPYGHSQPGSPAMGVPPPVQSFHQPQPYQHPNNANANHHLNTSGALMPPPKVPYSKTQDNAELEKANPRDMDVNNISDVLTGSGIDLRAEEEAMLHNVGGRNHYSASFNSQASGSTMSPHGSFNQWSQQAGHGAFQGAGPLSQPVSEEQQQNELLRKHEQAARALNQSAEQPLHDPFLMANALRHRMAKRAYDQGITVSLEGLFDKIPDAPRDVTRNSLAGSNGESIVVLQANSILNRDTPLVELISLVSLAAQERIRTVLEDAFALSQGRQNTSSGIVPPSLADIAAANGETVEKTVVPVNLSKTTWEAAPDSAVSPMTSTASKRECMRTTPPTPQPTIQVKTNHVTAALKRKMEEDERFEKLRVQKRQKRQQGNSATPVDTPEIAPLPMPEKLTKKERDRINKAGQTDEVLHQAANVTASLALGKKKKYSWMTSGSGSGAATPSRLNTAAKGNSGTTTPAPPTTDRALLARKRQFLGGEMESTDMGKKIQLRDLVHVLENDGRERKTLAQIISRMRSENKDEKKIEDRRSTVPPPR
ncbi:hypothetical protein DM02DRAFT_600639 [Periconia macrospinosa]|uniref:Transcription initiation factor TFIID subunit 4 n=1 Tax=Periconia macrospinosa TaxID=97972 RepID=A0A2V1DD92_9PLEO|nr:hypothetical protein DM02DRAFT_600639 [Periconia macrospinosa]